MRKIFLYILSLLSVVLAEAQQIVVENGRTYKLHTVEKGEGLYRLSVNNGVTQEEIIAANPQLKENGLTLGMTIRIPMKAAVTQSAQAYRLHIIQQGETLYSIGVKYGVKATDIIAVNQTLDVNAMPVGSLIRIPETDIPSEDEFFVYHRIAAGETLFALGVKYNVGQEVITSANPDINWQHLQVGQIVAVPKMGQERVVYQEHEVQRKETLYSITHQYDITAEALAEVNPGVNVYALQKGQVLRIPKKEKVGTGMPATINPMFVGTSTSVPVDNKPQSYTGKSIEIALMMPFDAANEMSRIKASEGEKTFKTYRFLEFYQGVRMAADTISQMGTIVKLHVFDTSDKMTLANICELNESRFDMIIGPAKADEMHSVACMAKATQTPMILPFAPMDSSINDNPYLFQASVIDTIFNKIVGEKIVDDCVGKNVILLTCATRSSSDIKRYDIIRNELKSRGIPYVQMTYDQHHSEKFLDALSVDKENVLLMPTTAEAQVNRVIVAIASVIEKKKDARFSLCGLGEWLTFQTIEVDVFHKLNTKIFTSFAIDYENESVQKIMSKYRREYSAEPVAFTPYFSKASGSSGFNAYAMWGYDIASFFIEAYKKYGKDMIKNTSGVTAEMVQSNMVFKPLTNWGGRVNMGLRTIMFTTDNCIKVKNL